MKHEHKYYIEAYTDSPYTAYYMDVGISTPIWDDNKKLEEWANRVEIGFQPMLGHATFFMNEDTPNKLIEKVLSPTFGGVRFVVKSHFELGLCPFCYAEELTNTMRADGCYYVECKNCGVRGPLGEDTKDAVTSWQRVLPYKSKKAVDK